MGTNWQMCLVNSTSTPCCENKIRNLSIQTKTGPTLPLYEDKVMNQWSTVFHFLIENYIQTSTYINTK